MKRNEQNNIEHFSDGAKRWGRIRLSHLAIPETVEVTILGEKLIPESFDIYGWPIFTEEAVELFRWKENEIRRLLGEDEFRLKANILYEEKIFEISRREFDTIKGIEKCLGDLQTFNQMLNNRKIFASTGKQLNEFVVFGNYWLDKFGRVRTCNTGEIFRKSIPKVMTKRRFSLMAKDIKYSYSTNMPNKESACPCCGKKFTIEDIAYGKIGIIKNKMCHDGCRKEYERYREVDKLSRGIVDFVYMNVPVEVIPNGYCCDEDWEHIPWLEIHTPNGDIIIGQKEEWISIEWQENFKPFDMSIFNDEYEIKWLGDVKIYKTIPKGNVEKNVKRGIYALGKDKACEYLKRVKELDN